MQRRARTSLAGISLAALAVLAWLVFGGGRSLPHRGTAAVLPGPAASDAGPLGVSLQEPEPSGARSRPPEESRPDTAQIPGAEGPAPAREPGPGTVELYCAFVRPDGEGLSVPRARVVVAGASGTRREIAVENAKDFAVAGLEPEPHDVTVEADGFLHRPQRFDLAVEAERGASRFGLSDAQRIYLWPAGFVAVVVRTPDGRPIAEVARELALEPKRLLVGAFAAHARRAEPASTLDEPEGGLVRFHPPHLYQSWELPGSGVGSLELLANPPMWIRLDLFGEPYAWRPLATGDTELVFTLDSAQIAARLASVALRVVDPAGAPVADARVTLKADTSAHRRKEQHGVLPGFDGGVAFERVVPGRYVLEIEAETGLREQRLDLAPGERRDLGDVVLAAGAALDLRIVDARGNPVLAWIELAEYRRGEPADRLYPPNLHRHTRTAGEYRMPMPSVASVVRATPSHPGTVLEVDGRRRSRSVLVDPAAPPLGPVLLVVGDPVELELDVRVAGTVTVRDDLDLVLFEQRVDAPQRLVARIPPGPSVVRREATERDPRFEQPLVLVAGRATLEVR